jgi:membrane-bound lytic murein transglycosylase B
MNLRGVIASFLVLAVGFMAAGSASANTQPVESWVADFKAEARDKGISAALLDDAFKDFQPIEKIIRLDRKQPEGTKTFTQYMESTLPAFRVNKGKELYQANKQLLDTIGEKYGVQPRFIVALWGMETSYGKVTGGFNVPHALATLAYDGRRADFFRDELLKALQIINEGHISLTDMKGSWAGAMGQSQFMPSSFLSYAVDYDGDGKRDIWGTKADVFASIANYLSQSGWNDDVTWGRKVTLPAGFDTKLADIKVFRPLSYYQDAGVRTEWGANLPQTDIEAALMFPGKESEPAYLIYSNYNVLLKWNRSRYFATAVGTLADRIAK